MKVISILLLLFSFTLVIESARADEQLNQMLDQRISKEEVRHYYKMLQELNPKLKDQNLLLKLEQFCGNHETYPMREVLLAADSSSLDKSKDYTYTPNDIKRRPPTPPGAFSVEDVSRYFWTVSKQEQIANYLEWAAQTDEARAKAPPKQVEDLNKALIDKYGPQPWYKADEVLDIEKKGSKNRGDKAPTVKMLRRESDWAPIWQGFQTLKIRKDWTDVVNSEDLSQTDTGKKALGDLEGATFSFSHDSNTKPFNGSKTANTWSTVGSVILPITWNGVAKNGLVTFMLAPSVSINRVSTSGNPTNNEVDHLDYRLGTYWKFLLFKRGLTALQTRASFVYGTDTGHHASLPAGELDLEPQVLFLNDKTENYDGKWHPNWWGLGYRNIIYPKEAPPDDQNDVSIADWQVRAWVHMEAGDLQRNGAKWDTVDGSFFRLGPTVQGKLNFPKFVRGFSISGTYSYMGTVDGPKGRNNLWKLGGAFTLYENKTLHEKLSLTADYTKGGLLLSKQPVDILNVGIGVVF